MLPIPIWLTRGLARGLDGIGLRRFQLAASCDAWLDACRRGTARAGDPARTAWQFVGNAWLLLGLLPTVTLAFVPPSTVAFRPLLVVAVACFVTTFLQYGRPATIARMLRQPGRANAWWLLTVAVPVGLLTWSLW